MKKIGIIGKSGAGKTTFSKMLQRNDKIAIINIDEIKKKFSVAVKEYENDMGEKVYAPKNEEILDLLDFLRRNKFLNKTYINILRFFEEKNVKKLINKYESENFNCVIIERRKIREFFCIQRFRLHYRDKSSI